MILICLNLLSKIGYADSDIVVSNHGLNQRLLLSEWFDWLTEPMIIPDKQMTSARDWGHSTCASKDMKRFISLRRSPLPKDCYK